jgi:predicted LPLAT superfamily acyltransferase
MAEDWRNQAERSTPVMLGIIVFLARHAPRSLVRLVLYPTVFYFMLTGGRARAASANYLRRALNRMPTWIDHWRHFFAFANCTLDRVFLLAHNFSGIRVTANRSAGVLPIAASGRGCLLIVAHFGSTEVLRFAPRSTEQPAPIGVVANHVTARATHVKTTILLDRQHGRMLMQFLEKLNPEMALDVIDASERGPQLVLRLKEALQDGRMVCVMADRVADEEGFVVVNFLGARARFSVSPWLLATALHVPIILGFGIFLGGNRYAAHFELFAENISLSRGRRAEEIAEFAQQYAARLEYYVRSAPYNWFNFYDYWLSDDDASARTDETVAD